MTISKVYLVNTVQMISFNSAAYMGGTLSVITNLRRQVIMDMSYVKIVRHLNITKR